MLLNCIVVEVTIFSNKVLIAFPKPAPAQAQTAACQHGMVPGCVKRERVTVAEIVTVRDSWCVEKTIVYLSLTGQWENPGCMTMKTTAVQGGVHKILLASMGR